MTYRLSARFAVAGGGRLVPLVPDIDEAARHYRARDYPAVDRACDAILARDPQHFDALHLRGVSCLEQERPREALRFLHRAARLRPDDPRLLFHIGNVMQVLRRPASAERAFRRALALRPDDADALNNLANALTALGRYEEAIACLRRVMRLRPDSPQPVYNLGRALLDLDRPEEAEQAFRAALRLGGESIEPRRLIDLHSSLTEALVRQARYRDALALCRNAPPPVRDAAENRWNQSLALLALGEYEAGWRAYEVRFDVPDHDAPRPGAHVLDLDAVAGRRVLVFPEQGRGDLLQFARFLPMLAARGATVLVETHADLLPLMAAIEGVAAVVAADDPLPDHDLLTPLLSLPAAFGTTLATVPAAVPYLRVPPLYAARWAARLGPRTAPRIGIAWRGSQASAPRSALPLPLLAPLLALSGLEFHCLQKEISTTDRDWLAAHAAVAVHDAALGDFADTAALIASLDLVISIDTAVAHVAGALARPVWIMLPFSADWRWLQDRSASPWYPTARLFRQPKRGAWGDVVARVVALLEGACLGDGNAAAGASQPLDAAAAQGHM